MNVLGRRCIAAQHNLRRQQQWSCPHPTDRVNRPLVCSRGLQLAFRAHAVDVVASSSHLGLARKHICQSASRPAATEDDVVRYASVGDIVSCNFVIRGEDGEVIQSSEKDLGEPLTFEVGTGDAMGNRLFQGFDEAVRGMAVGQTIILEASGGDWNRELLFTVPRDHPEVQRLEGRYKNHGGLAPGLVVELANGAMAVILQVSDSEVQLDANNMMAGKTFTIELQLLAIDTAAPTGGSGSGGNSGGNSS